MMRIYISGPISGHADFKERFAEAADRLRKEFKEADIVNPALVNDILPFGTHDEYMKICIDLLEMSDMIYMLHDWRNSTGACIEYGYALAQDKMIVKEEREEG